MYCERCGKREATIHLEKYSGNNGTAQHLCAECARESGDVPEFSANPFMAGLLDSLEHSGLKVEYIRTTACSKCGTTYAQYRETGMLGCGACYEAFADKLKPLIRRTQGSEHHVGKTPSRMKGSLRLRRQIRRMREDLETAVGQEDYERAASLRDRIRSLEKELEGIRHEQDTIE